VRSRGEAGDNTTNHSASIAKSLARLIAKTMPEDRDQKMLSRRFGESRGLYLRRVLFPGGPRSQPPARIQLARLTVRQYLNSAADLLSSFRNGATLDERRGLDAEYTMPETSTTRSRPSTRVDPRIEFNLAIPSNNKIDRTNLPSAGAGGSSRGDGDYDSASNGEWRVWVNNESKMLIDAW